MVLFAGSAKDRDLIEEYEFYRSGGGGSKRGREVKFHVLLVSYDTLLKVRAVTVSAVRRLRMPNYIAVLRTGLQAISKPCMAAGRQALASNAPGV